MKKKTYVFAIAAAALIIGFFFAVNYITSWSHPWFIYPTFAVLWWPLSIIASQNKGKNIMAIFGSLLIAGFLALANHITSPGFPWAVFPIFAVAWWPLAQITCRAKRYRLFAVPGSLMTSAFFVWLNLTTSPHFWWFIFPVFAVLWWPLAVFFAGRNQWKLFSVIGAAYIIGFFAVINWQASPNTLWFFYPAYAVLWWPLAMFFANKRTIKFFSVLMSALTVGLLAAINLLYSPHVIWFVWTIFYFAWWPLCQCLGEKAKTLVFAVIGAAAVIAYHVAVYLVLTPGVHPWYLYMILPAVWWPVTMALKENACTLAFLLVSAVVFSLYYGVINWLYCPTYFWSIYLLYPAAWAVIGGYFGARRRFFALSIWGAVITIVFFTVVNIITSPHHIWAVYPAFAILFWPMSLYFFGQQSKKAVSKP